MIETEWSDALREIGEAWPKSTWTDVSRGIWRRALIGASLLDVREAIFRVRTRYSSATPEVAWFLRVLREIAEEKVGAMHDDEGAKRRAAQVVEDRIAASAAAVSRMRDDLLDPKRIGWSSLDVENIGRRNLGDDHPDARSPDRWSDGFVALVWRYLEEAKDLGIKTIPAPRDTRPLDRIG